jgi:outer membrane receptor protein involved in Fe transport
MGVETFQDFAVRVPNLGFGNESDGRFNSNSPAIRGVFGANTTGFYIDDIPVPMSMQPRVLDIERIEVLRGPQGTLYGARSMGGTIRMISKQPVFDETSGKVHGTLSTVKEGDLNWSLDASINLPIIEEKMAVRMMAYYGANSGVFDREYQSSWVNAQTGATVQTTAPAFERQENVDDETYGGFQILAKIALSEDVTFSPRFMYQKVDADGLPFADISPSNFTEKRFFNIQESGSDRWFAVSGTFNWDLGNANIVSTTSYFDRYLNEREEESTFIHTLFNTVIGLVIDPLEGSIDENETYKSFVHETRYVSAWEGQFQLTAGIFYQKSKNHLKYPPARIAGLDAAVAAVSGPPAITGGGDLIFETDSKFDVEEIAAFTEISYDITEDFTFTAGLRVYKTTTKADVVSNGFANDGKTTLNGIQSNSGVNPKFLLQYSASDDLDFYASASKGFRIGGINGNLPAGLCKAELTANNIDPSKVKTYNSDPLWSYELGRKSR